MTALSASESRLYVGSEVVILFTEESKVISSSYGFIERDDNEVWVDSTDGQRFWFIDGDSIDKTLFFIPISQIQIPA